MSSTWPPEGGLSSLHGLLQAFVAITSEREEEPILEQVVDLARIITQARYGAAATLSGAEIDRFVYRGLTTGQVQAMPHLPEGKGMLAAVLEDRRPVRLDDIGIDDRSVGFPLGHVPMQAFLGVPMLSDGRLLGAVYLTKPPGHPSFTEQDTMFMMALADQAAVALGWARLLRDVGLVNEELRITNQMKSDFVSMASHELRTPLTSIVGFASTLTDYWDMTPDPDKRQYVHVIDRQARRLFRLVNDLLAMSRLDAGTVESRAEDVEVEPAVREVLDDVGPQGALFVVSCPRVILNADPDHLRQILLNYVDNALHYGEAPYAIEVSEAFDAIEIRVRDQGPGVPQDLRPQLFDKFTQAGTGLSRNARGTGLGLSIVRGLSEVNGGEAWHEPNHPRGACFGVRLPKGRGRPTQDAR